MFGPVLPKRITSETKMSRRHSLVSASKVFTSDVIRTIKSSIFSVLVLSQLFIGHEHYTEAAISSRSSQSSTTTSASSTKAEKFGAYMERQPESTIAPLYDEVLFECGLNLMPDRIEWRFRPQKQRQQNNSNGYLGDYIYLKKMVWVYLSHMN